MHVRGHLQVVIGSSSIIRDFRLSYKQHPVISPDNRGSTVSKVQRDAALASWFYCNITLHVSCTFHTHHQGYQLYQWLWTTVYCTPSLYIYILWIVMLGPGSSVGIATEYGLDGPWIESRWGEIVRKPPDRPWGPLSLLYNGYRVFHGGKAAGAWRWPPTPS
jgi:hypothetical protein